MALSGVYSVTKEPIAKNELQKQTAAYRAVCPDAAEFEELAAANDLMANQDQNKTPRVTNFYVAKSGGAVVGYAMSVVTKGFGGDLEMAIGLDAEGKIQKIEFTKIQETAGLGMRATEDAFRDQFTGKSGTLVLNQDIDALNSATITSTAGVGGVNAGLEFFETVTKGGN